MLWSAFTDRVPSFRLPAFASNINITCGGLTAGARIYSKTKYLVLRARCNFNCAKPETRPKRTKEYADLSLQNLGMLFRLLRKFCVREDYNRGFLAEYRRPLPDSTDRLP